MGNFKENLSRNYEMSWRDFNDLSAKSGSFIYGDVFEQVFKICLAYVLYFFLSFIMKLDTVNSGFVMKHLKGLWNYVMVDVILGSYWGLLHQMVVGAIIAAIIPSALYAVFCFLSYKNTKIKSYSPIVAYILIIIIIFILFNVGFPSVFNFEPPKWPGFNILRYDDYIAELYAKCKGWFSGTWDSIIEWAKSLLLISSAAVIIALQFHSKEFGTKVAMCVIFIVNASTFVSLGVIGAILGAIPIISGPSDYIISAIRLCFNFMIISDLFIVIAVGNLSKLAVDYAFYRYTLNLPDGSCEQPAQVSLSEDGSAGYVVEPVPEALSADIELIPAGANAVGSSVQLSVAGMLTLGRDTEGEGVDIQSDGSISRKHCEFAFSQGGLSVRDLGSTNGTKLNGVSVSESAAVNDGDRLELGNMEFCVRIIKTATPVESTVQQGFSSEQIKELLSKPVFKYAAAGLIGLAAIFVGYQVLTHVRLTSNINTFKSETEQAAAAFNGRKFRDSQQHLSNAINVYRENEENEKFKKAVYTESNTWAALNKWFKSPGLKVTAWYFNEKSAWKAHFDSFGEVAPDPLFVITDKDGIERYREFLGNNVKSPRYVSSDKFRLLCSGNKVIFKDQNVVLDTVIYEYDISDISDFYNSLSAGSGGTREWRMGIIDNSKQDVCDIGFDVTYPTAEELVENFSK